MEGVKRFASFAWCGYDACGGWNDLNGFFDTAEEAVAWTKAEFGVRPWYWQVVDLMGGDVVGEGSG